MDRERVYIRPTMAVPAPGFTARVMARIEQRERTIARRRAILGAVILIAASSILLLLAGWVVVSVISPFLSSPGDLLSGIFAFAPVVDIAGSLVRAFAVSVETLIRVGSLQMFVYALVVCAMTLVWAFVVHSSLQWIPRTLVVGGLE